MNEDVLRLKVVCRNLPGLRFDELAPSEFKANEPVYLGIQRDKKVINRVPADRRQVTFHPEFVVKKQPDGKPNFLGSYAQGRPKNRFFYLSWGIEHESGGFQMFRRLKIFLGTIGWPEIQRCLKAGKPLEVRLRLTDDNGGPLCGTPREEHIQWDS